MAQEGLRSLCREPDRRCATAAHSCIDGHPASGRFRAGWVINWIYQWYQPNGSLDGEAIVRQYTEIFFRGLWGRKRQWSVVGSQFSVLSSQKWMTENSRLTRLSRTFFLHRFDNSTDLPATLANIRRG